jgi:hypothetical protein
MLSSVVVECHSQENNGFKIIDYQALSRGFQEDSKGIPRGFQGIPKCDGIP